MVISEKIGEYYEKDGVRGIIAAVDNNDNPTLLLALDEPEEEMTWNETIKWSGGWHLPNKEELEKIWFIDNTYDNPITQRLNAGLKKVGGKELRDGYWSSSEYYTTHNYYLYTNLGDVFHLYKNFRNGVRAVFRLKVDCDTLKNDVVVLKKEELKEELDLITKWFDNIKDFARTLENPNGFILSTERVLEIIGTKAKDCSEYIKILKTQFGNSKQITIFA